MADKPPRNSQDDNQRQQPSQGQPQQQRGQGQSQRGRQPQGPPRGGPPNDDDGLSRRQLLLGGGGAVAVAGGGWYFFLRSRGPVGTVEAFYSAADSGNVDGVNELIHADGTLEPVSQSEIDSDTGYTVESAEVVDEDSGYSAGDADNVQAFEVVETEVTIASQGEQNTETRAHIVAKNSGGAWKMYA